MSQQEELTSTLRSPHAQSSESAASCIPSLERALLRQDSSYKITVSYNGVHANENK